MEQSVEVLKQILDYEIARVGNADRWVSACGGLEVPFFKSGERFLYVYNFATSKHGYLNLGQDIVFDSLPLDN